MSPKEELARRVLETLAQGHQVSTNEALQLRNWAVCPEDSVLTLEVIARRILDHETGKRLETGDQGAAPPVSHKKNR